MGTAGWCSADAVGQGVEVGVAGDVHERLLGHDMPVPQSGRGLLELVSEDGADQAGVVAVEVLRQVLGVLREVIGDGRPVVAPLDLEQEPVGGQLDLLGAPGLARGGRGGRRGGTDHGRSGADRGQSVSF